MMNRIRRNIALLFALQVLIIPFAGCATRGAFDLGFLASRDTTPEGNSRLRVLGPFFEQQEMKDGSRSVAFRPFYSSTCDKPGGRELQEYLWPVGMRKDQRNETYWRVLSAFGHDFASDVPDSRYRFIIFPIVFAGRASDGEGYFAVFPLGGKIKEFLMEDEIIFALFPLYTYSVINDVRSHDILYPVISWTSGGDVSRFRIFPFYGRSANGDKWEKTFVMWPVWNSVNYNYKSSTGGGYVLFPVYGHMKLTDQETWWAVPPFFRLTLGEKMNVVNCPWPFIQYSSGEREKLYIWPLWGMKNEYGVKSSFFLWPMGRTEKIDRVDYNLNRFFLIPLIFYESKVAKQADVRDQKTEAGDRKLQIELAKNTGTNPVAVSVVTGGGTNDVQVIPAAGAHTGGAVLARYFKLWPLMSYRRENDVARFSMLDLWPTKGMSSLERNMAPIWTVYSYTSAGEATENELLWGLYRHYHGATESGGTSLFPLFSVRRESEDSGEWNFLLGLTGCKREGLQKTWRLLYFIKFHTGGAKEEEEGSQP